MKFEFGINSLGIHFRDLKQLNAFSSALPINIKLRLEGMRTFHSFPRPQNVLPVPPKLYVNSHSIGRIHKDEVGGLKAQFPVCVYTGSKSQ